MSAKLISSTIAKAAIAEFLGLPKSTRVSKDVLIEKLLALLEINPEAKAQFEENHVKFLRGIKYSDVYATRREAWYRRKNEAMQVLAQTPYAKLTFYRPENPHKESLYLCDEHYEMKREGFYETKWDFFADHAKEIAKCPHCFYQREKDYYSLYHLEITVPGSLPFALSTQLD